MCLLLATGTHTIAYFDMLMHGVDYRQPDNTIIMNSKLIWLLLVAFVILIMSLNHKE